MLVKIYEKKYLVYNNKKYVQTERVKKILNL